ncbi:MAG: lytic transglycosylase domain-containing protein [Gammaproteobacteria bacterium]|nr:lytic transglycosylase domain-containing protein [Gammaproteobacteria bacterium]
MARPPYQISLAVSVLFLWLAAPSVLAAKYFVYQLPDGSRVVTDRLQPTVGYKLVKSARNMQGVGQSMAGKAELDPKLTTPYEGLIEEVAARHEVETALVKAVIHTESYFNPRAKSTKGATGLMQLMPETARRYGVRNVRELRDPEHNIEAGVQHLRYLLEKYPDNLAHALAAYNAGEEAVHKYQGIPPFGETRRYVQKVLSYHEFYREMN